MNVGLRQHKSNLYVFHIEVNCSTKYTSAAVRLQETEFLGHVLMLNTSDLASLHCYYTARGISKFVGTHFNSLLVHE